MAMSQDLSDARGAADGLAVLIGALLGAGKYGEARARLEELLAIREDLGAHGWRYAFELGGLDLHQGRYESARVHAEMAVTNGQEIGALHVVESSLWVLGNLAVREGAYAEARRLATEIITMFQGRPELPPQSWPVQCCRCLLAYAELGLGVPEEARHYVVQALQWLAERGEFRVLPIALPVAALLLLDEGKIKRAVEIYELACTLPHVANSQWYEDVVGRPIAEAAEGLAPDVAAAARERGRARDMQATLDELLEEWEE